MTGESPPKNLAMNSPPPDEPRDVGMPHHKSRNRPEPFSSLVELDVSGLSHPGKKREINEDHFVIVRFGRFFEALQTNLAGGLIPPRSEEGGFGMAVADGLGGSAAG